MRGRRGCGVNASCLRSNKGRLPRVSPRFDAAYQTVCFHWGGDRCSGTHCVLVTSCHTFVCIVQRRTKREEAAGREEEEVQEEERIRGLGFDQLEQNQYFILAEPVI